jgi:carbonic anhydrase
MGIHVHDNIPQDLSPVGALKRLKDGNHRFINNLKLNRNLLEQVNDTKDGQWPFAAILSCMDSRTSAELIFDQGLGDIFSIRIAGNVITPGILGSLEYATAVAHSKLILVLGHTSCGAIKGACDDVKFGNLTSLLEKIKPSVSKVSTGTNERSSSNSEFVNNVAKVNVYNSVQQIMENSEVIRDLIDKGEAGIVPAMYDVATGVVTFYEQEARIKVLAEHQNQYNSFAS